MVLDAGRQSPYVLRLRRKAGCIAQLVEQLTLNQRVSGSNPDTPTIGFNELTAVWGGAEACAIAAR